MVGVVVVDLAARAVPAVAVKVAVKVAAEAAAPRVVAAGVVEVDSVAVDLEVVADAVAVAAVLKRRVVIL